MHVYICNSIPGFDLVGSLLVCRKVIRLKKREMKFHYVIFSQKFMACSPSYCSLIRAPKEIDPIPDLVER